MAAEQGFVEAQYNLGNAYKHGEGVEQNFEEVVKWYRMSAEQGYDCAQYNLGLCYVYGDGVEHNYDEAVKWLRLAAKQGNSDAKRLLKRLNEIVSDKYKENGC